jgi:hypothetical protein
MTRPDYIQCISHPRETLKPLCGGEYKPFFVNLDHALLNALQGGRLVACPDCIDKVVGILEGDAE